MLFEQKTSIFLVEVLHEVFVFPKRQ